jgi:CRISPR-associated protein Cas2
MVVMILRKAPPAIKGGLSRWLFEPHPGVYVGHVSARVRDELWKLCCEACDEDVAGIIQVWSTNTEQRFDVRVFGKILGEIIDSDGLKVVRRRLPPHRRAGYKRKKRT